MRSFLTAAGLLAAGLAGCSPANVTPAAYPVSGKVLLPDGRPAFGAEIDFVPKEKDGKRTGSQGAGVLDKDGGFKLTSMGGVAGLPSGYYVVVINPNVLPATMAADKKLGTQTIPKKYWSEDTSNLTAEVTGSTSDLVFQLTK